MYNHCDVIITLYMTDPLLRRLFPPWSLPTVLIVLASVPFETVAYSVSLPAYVVDGVFSGLHLGPQGQFLKGPFYRSRALTLGGLWGSFDP